MTEPVRRVLIEPRALARCAGVFLGLVAAIGATYVVPGLAALRPWVPGGDYVPFWNIVGREFLGQGAALAREQASVLELQQRTLALAARPTPEQRPDPPPEPAPAFPPYASDFRVQRPAHTIEFASDLDHYFRKLTLVDLGVQGAIARAGHWGDSVLGADGITSAIRRRLQSRFGDAGPGFHMMDRYNPSYRHQDVEFEPGGGWFRCLVVQECRKQDRRYGYGGLTVNSSGGGLSTWRTARRGFGQNVARFELWFARQENGGNFRVTVDANEPVTVSSRGPELEDAWFEIEVPPGPHTFSVRAAGGGDARAYGVVLENEGPGVVWDGMTLIGGSTRGLRTQDPEHVKTQIRRRDLDLVVFLFGGNDMQRNYVDLKGSMQPYYDEYGDVVQRFRAGKPGAACLIMSVTDHGIRRADGSIQSRAFLAELANGQREVARRNGCGFFDTYQAMGGTGSAARWFRARPRLIEPDLGHPTGLGHQVIAGLLTDAVLWEYQNYRDRMEGEPLPELSSGSGDAGGGGSVRAVEPPK